MSKHAKSSRKRSSAAKLLYLILVLILIILMLYALKWLWNFAERYQAGSIDTLLRQASLKVSQETGLEIGYSSVPTVEKNGDSSFVLTHEKKPIGRVFLSIKEMGPFSQAIYEIKDIQANLSFEFETVEGVELTVEGKRLEAYQEEIFPGTEVFEKYTGNKVSPKTYRYRAENLFTRFQVEAKSTGYKLAYTQQQDGTIRIDRISEDDALNDALKARAFQIAKAYSGYISTDVSWATLSSMIMNGSPLLQSIPSMDVQWYTTHNAIRYENVLCSEPVMLNDYYALVQISYDFIVSSNWTTYAPGSDVTYPIQLTQYLHLDDDGIWRLADMNILLRLDLEMEPLETN